MLYYKIYIVYRDFITTLIIGVLSYKISHLAGLSLVRYSMGIDHSNPYIHSTTVLCDKEEARIFTVYAAKYRGWICIAIRCRKEVIIVACICLLYWIGTSLLLHFLTIPHCKYVRFFLTLVWLSHLHIPLMFTVSSS